MAELVRLTKRKTLFLMGLMLTSMVGFLGGVVRGSFSNAPSLFESANADIPPACNPPWSQAQCDIYFGCFPAESVISTPTGGVAIQDIKVGDSVYTFDSSTGEKSVSSVSKTFIHHKDDPDYVYSPLIVLKHEKGSLTVTDNHWIYRKNNRQDEYTNFDRAGQLAVGDLLTMEDGTSSKIVAIEPGEVYDSVYNFEVDNTHTYLAEGVMVHNSGAGGCCGACGCGGK